MSVRRCTHVYRQGYVCEHGHVSRWVGESVRVHTCVNAQAESHSGWETGNVDSAGGYFREGLTHK